MRKKQYKKTCTGEKTRKKQAPNVECQPRQKRIEDEKITCQGIEKNEKFGIWGLVSRENEGGGDMSRKSRGGGT